MGVIGKYADGSSVNMPNKLYCILTKLYNELYCKEIPTRDKSLIGRILCKEIIRNRRIPEHMRIGYIVRKDFKRIKEKLIIKRKGGAAHAQSQRTILRLHRTIHRSHLIKRLCARLRALHHVRPISLARN